MGRVNPNYMRSNFSDTVMATSALFGAKIEPDTTATWLSALVWYSAVHTVNYSTRTSSLALASVPIAMTCRGL